MGIIGGERSLFSQEVCRTALSKAQSAEKISHARLDPDCCLGRWSWVCLPRFGGKLLPTPYVYGASALAGC